MLRLDTMSKGWGLYLATSGDFLMATDKPSLQIDSGGPLLGSGSTKCFHPVGVCCPVLGLRECVETLFCGSIVKFSVRGLCHHMGTARRGMDLGIPDGALLWPVVALAALDGYEPWSRTGKRSSALMQPAASGRADERAVMVGACVRPR